MRGRSVRVGVVVATVLAVAGCGAAPSAPTAPVPSATSTPADSPQVQPAGEPTVVASGLDAPWSVVRPCPAR